MSEALQILTPLLSGFGTWSWMQDLKWTLRRSAGKESATLEQSPLLLRSTDAKAFQALVTATNQGCEYFFSVYKGDFILTLIVSSSLDI